MYVKTYIKSVGGVHTKFTINKFHIFFSGWVRDNHKLHPCIRAWVCIKNMFIGAIVITYNIQMIRIFICIIFTWSNWSVCRCVQC